MHKSGLISGGKINQVSLYDIEEHDDARGSFAEVFQQRWNSVVDPVQWSIVKSKKNVLRGMHLHQRHDEYFSLISGHCLVALKDVRADSSTHNAYSLYELSGEDMVGLAFPRGIVHGWYFYDDCIHLQGVSESYLDYHKDDNQGCQWNSRDLGIPWPISNPLLSDRSEGFTSLSDLLATSQSK